MTNRSLLDQAIQFLVERGWPVLPSTGPQKKPCVGWKRFQDQLPTVDLLHYWERKFKPERWGLVTGALSGDVVADFDGQQGVELMQKWGIVPHRRTGSGGFHCHLQYPGWRVPTLNAKSSKLSWPWPGLDIRGDGGFAVVLGRNTNGPYEQLRELVPEPFDALPEAVRTFLRNNSQKDPNPRPQSFHQHAINVGRGRVDSERLIRNALDMVSGNGRNNSGFWLACQLRDNGYSIGEAEVAMRAYQSCVPSTNTKGQREEYTERDARASLHAAYSRPARDPWRTGSVLHASASVAAPSLQGEIRPDTDSLGTTENPRQGDAADGPVNLDIDVDHHGGTVPDQHGVPQSSGRYARIPSEVLTDRHLNARDVRVYGVLAGFCRQGSVAQVGKRLLAKLACCAPRKALESVNALVAAGHVQKAEQRTGHRAIYVLASKVFGQKQRAGVDEVAVGPSGGLRLVSVRKDQGKAWTPRPRSLPKPKRVNSTDPSEQQ